MKPKEKGTQIIRVTTGICNDCGHTWQTQDAPKKRKTWLWVLGWIFIFPLPLTIILIRKKDMNNILKYALIALAWIVYLAISISAGINNNSDRDTNTKAEANPSTTIASSSETESNKSTNIIDSEKETKEITSEIGSETETKETTSKIGSETEAFVNAFNNKSTVKLLFKDSFDPQDKTSGHYRTEFRLTTYRDAIGNSYDYNGKTVDLIERQGVFDEKPVIRLYADDISIDECCEIIESSVNFFDPELSQEDISEIATYIKEKKAVNGYYKGNVSILYQGDLMIKNAND